MYLYAQVIDDESGKTLFSISSKGMKKGGVGFESARELGKTLAKSVIAGNIKKVVFDRGGYMYTGKVRALADGAREGGLEF